MCACLTSDITYCSARDRQIILSEDQAKQVVFECACQMDIIELDKYGRYITNVGERREVFVTRLVHYVRKLYFGSFTSRFIRHVLTEMSTTSGSNWVRNRLDALINEDKRRRWRDQLVDMNDAKSKSKALTYQLIGRVGFD